LLIGGCVAALCSRRCHRLAEGCRIPLSQEPKIKAA
jgi:hypothetical protein